MINDVLSVMFGEFLKLEEQKVLNPFGTSGLTTTIF